MNSALQMCSTLNLLVDLQHPLHAFFVTMRAGKPADPRIPRMYVMKKYANFRNTAQHDSHEWVLALLDTIEYDQKNIKEITDGIFDVSVAFVGCGHVSRHEEPFRVLSLDLPRPGGTLEDAYMTFASPVVVQCACVDDCKSTVVKRAIKTMQIKSVPPILIIHWKRFEFVHRSRVGKKVEQRVKVPLTWRGYRLTGFVNHRGRTPSAGHYTACIHRNGQWYLISDSSVTPILERHAIKAAEAAYMLSFQKI